jgi:hypothetical protein
MFDFTEKDCSDFPAGGGVFEWSRLSRIVGGMPTQAPTGPKMVRKIGYMDWKNKKGLQRFRVQPFEFFGGA